VLDTKELKKEFGEEEVSNYLWLFEFTKCLRGARRNNRYLNDKGHIPLDDKGNLVDNPEGIVYIEISDTLARELEKRLETVLGYVLSTYTMEEYNG